MGNKYQTKKKLGEGGFGIVYLVEKNNKQYALKKIRIALNEAEKEEYNKKFKILKKLGCEFIIQYYETYNENNCLNIVMEFAGEKNLKQLIANYKNRDELIKENIISDIIAQLCLGLKEIHKNRLIHRDLTPDNIFINENNNKIKIGDFGIAKMLATNQYAQSKVGKYKYFAPEIEIGARYNNKIDIYSLGCIIYELFTLNEYYIDKNIRENDCKIDSDVYNPQWQNLIELLLQKDYHRRPDIEKVISMINTYHLCNFKKYYNYIFAEIYIDEKNVNKEVRIINSYEEYIRAYSNNKNLEMELMNEEKIKNCEIIIDDDLLIPFNYFYKFNKEGKHNLKYSFRYYLTKINFLFSNCSSLTNLDLSNFNTKNVKDMSGMFEGCTSLTKIDLSNFNTQNVQHMLGMFMGCSSLINLNLANFDTQNVQDMSGMFMGCSSLINLNLSNFNTQNVKNMTSMFEGCSSLTNLNLSNFIIIQNDFIFPIPYYNSAIKMILYFPQYILSATNMKFMFRYCSSLRRENIIANDNRIFEQFFEDNN